MTSYYTAKLSDQRLHRVYQLAAPRVQQYLEAEILHLLGQLRNTDSVLELGCGYGRVSLRLAAAAAQVTGIDVSASSLELARELATSQPNCRYLQMDACNLEFEDESFDVVACVQNGVCAFNVAQDRLIQEAWRVLRPAGTLLLSTYCDAFWPARLAWFEAQAQAGLIGPLERAACVQGTIRCTDGFQSSRATAAQFEALCQPLGVKPRLVEVDESSLWCELTKPGGTTLEQRHPTHH